MTLLCRLNNILLKVANLGVIAFTGMIAIIIPYEAFGRYILANMSPWSGEVATFSLVWASMLGAAVGMRKGYHVGMTTALAIVPPRTSIILQKTGALFLITFLAILSYFGLSQMINNLQQLSPATQIPMAVPYAALPTGFIIMLLFSIEEFLKTSSRQQGGEV